MSLPSRPQPSRKSETPVSNVAAPKADSANVSAFADCIVAIVGARVTIMAASKAAVLLSGPATAERKLLVRATMVAVTAVVISAAAMPCVRNGCRGPAKMSAP